jgi:parallel beta-helix repeat protein
MSEGERKPAAFLSYSHADTDVERVTEFRKQLSQEVAKQIGEEFLIFQDEDGVQWGDNWQERIEESLDEVTFFIPVITPGFFKSAHCREELERFLHRERQVNRRDLILPVYYGDYPLFNDTVRRKADPLVETIAARHYADWRGLRLEPSTSLQVEEMMAQLATNVHDALKRLGGNEMSPPLQGVDPTSGSAETVRQPPKTDIPVHVVDMYARDGDYHAYISRAIEAANPGDRILIRPGLYQESVVMDKPLEIFGEGDVSEIVIEGWGTSALTFATTLGRVVNLTLTTRPKMVTRSKTTRSESVIRFFDGIEETEFWDEEVAGDCLEISQGRPEIEGCDISSNGGTGITIDGGADPRLRRNYIHDCTSQGIYISGYARPTLEDNDIDSNLNGVMIREGTAMLRGNRIHDNSMNGIQVVLDARATLEDNEIFDNARIGVAIREGKATLRRNRITGNTNGIYVNGGRATIEDNDLRNNTEDNFFKEEGTEAVIRLARNEGRVEYDQ